MGCRRKVGTWEERKEDERKFPFYLLGTKIRKEINFEGNLFHCDIFKI